MGRNIQQFVEDYKASTTDEQRTTLEEVALTCFNEEELTFIGELIDHGKESNDNKESKEGTSCEVKEAGTTTEAESTTTDKVAEAEVVV